MNGLFKLGCTFVLASCGVLAGGAYGNDEASEYSIKMNRPMAVGQQFDVRAKGTQQTDLRDPAAANESATMEVLTVNLNGAATVLAIDSHGRPTAIKYRVAQCTMDQNGTMTTIAPEGATLMARDDKGMTKWEINGQPMSNELTNIMQMFGLITGERTVDDMLGTEQPRTIGESWAIDRESVASAMKRELNTDVNADTVFGASTLVEAIEHGGTPCTVIYTQVSADNCAPPKEAINGFEIRESTATATFQGIYPQNTSKPAVSNSRSMTVKAVVVDRNGAKRELNWSRFVEFETTFSSGHVATGAEVEMND